MQKCLKSNTYQIWANLSFPLFLIEKEQKIELPEFKQHLNLIEKITNPKINKSEPAKPEKTKREKKESFFKRLFKGKKNKTENQ